MIAYEIAGSHGSYSLFVHGWLRSAASFAPLRHLAETCNERWIFADLRGYGRSRAMAGDDTVEEAAQDLLELMDGLGIVRARWVGHSMGGLIIQEVARLAPTRVDHLVGIAPVPLSGIALDAGALAVYESACRDPKARARILTRLTAGAGFDPPPEEWLARSLEETLPEALVRYLHSWGTRRDGTLPAQPSPIPMTLLLGCHDPAITQARVDQAFVPGYTHLDLHWIEDAGHFPLEEQPEAVRAYFQKPDGRSPNDQ